VFTLTQCFNDEGEGEEAEEEYIEFLESGEDSAEALQPSEEALDLISLLVKRPVILPRLDAIGLGRNYRDHAEAEHQLPGFIAFVGSIHQHWKTFWHGAEFSQQGTSFGRVVCVARGQREGYGRSSIRGNQMNLGVPPAA
jgi:hypothetical protein